MNIRLPIWLNDWLNDRVRHVKRLHGSKVPKETLIQCMIEIFHELDKAGDIKWEMAQKDPDNKCVSEMLKLALWGDKT